jgi:hypothetical protein
MKLAKGASFRFTPITDQRYATRLTQTGRGLGAQLQRSDGLTAACEII